MPSTVWQQFAPTSPISVGAVFNAAASACADYQVEMNLKTLSFAIRTAFRCGFQTVQRLSSVSPRFFTCSFGSSQIVPGGSSTTSKTERAKITRCHWLSSSSVIRAEIDVRITARTIELFHRGQRVAAHHAAGRPSARH